MKREYHHWHSPNLQREMELLVFGDTGMPVLFFPTRTARFYDYENWGIIDAVKDKINSGRFTIYCVDSYDAESFYAAIPPEEKIKKHQLYEQYILDEVLPFIHERSNAPGRAITVAGCSLGGYHAVNIAFRHPQLFTRVLGMSARYDLTLSSKQFPDLLDGFKNEDIYFHMPGMYLPHLTDPVILHQLRKLTVDLVIGRDDPFYENNRHISRTLTEKHIPHQLHVWNEEAHRPRHWRSMVQWYL